jgi:hypothetical protein
MSRSHWKPFNSIQVAWDLHIAAPTFQFSPEFGMICQDREYFRLVSVGKSSGFCHSAAPATGYATVRPRGWGLWSPRTHSLSHKYMLSLSQVRTNDYPSSCIDRGQPIWPTALHLTAMSGCKHVTTCLANIYLLYSTGYLHYNIFYYAWRYYTLAIFILPLSGQTGREAPK